MAAVTHDEDLPANAALPWRRGFLTPTTFALATAAWIAIAAIVWARDLLTVGPGVASLAGGVWGGMIESWWTGWFGSFGAWVVVALAASVLMAATLAWNPVSSPALSGYMLYYGPAAGNYTSKIDVGNTTMRAVANLTEGATYHFAVTAYDSSHTESAFSNDASTTVPAGAPVAGFTASATSGVAPLAMNFTNTSTGSIASYAWTFGDGTSSTAQSASHVYSAAGVFSVRTSPLPDLRVSQATRWIRRE